MKRYDEMKVSELIEELQKIPQDLIVVMEDEISISCGRDLPNVRTIQILDNGEVMLGSY